MKDPLEESYDDVSRGAAAWSLLVIVIGLVVLAIVAPGARTPLAIVLGLVLMIMLHEAGHFWAAKRSGMKVTEFFLGFGPRLWSFRRGETEYGVKAIPAGGYVRILGMNNLEEVDPADEHRTYRQARYRNRMVTVLAGVTVNIVIAIILFAVVIAGRGQSELNNKLGAIKADSPAHVAGLATGDKIVAVDGQRIDGWTELVAAIQARPRQSTSLEVRRGDETFTVDATPRTRDGLGVLGVYRGTTEKSVGLLAAVPEAFVAVKDLTVGMGESIGNLVTPDGVADYSRNFTANAPKAGSAEEMSRPMSLFGIVDRGSEIVDGDVWSLLWLLGGISLILALFNLIPLPPFDGGHAAVVLYEWAASKVKHRKVEVDYKKLVPVAAIVLLFFLTLSLSALFLDVRYKLGG